MTEAKHILIVDDDPDAIHLLEVFLKARGYQTEAARDGREALDKVRENQPALVLLDVMMPLLDGFAVLQEMQIDFPEVAVIMVTAISDPRSGNRAMELGAVDFITKPVDLKQLEKVIKWAVTIFEERNK